MSTEVRAASSASESLSTRRLSAFDGAGYDKGRSWLVQALWFAALNLVFKKWWCPGALRVWLLRVFGAEVASGVLIRHNVRVLWPWKLRIGSDSWIGEDVWLLNLEPIAIGADVCLSQGAMLCTGSHDRRAIGFGYDNGPIAVADGCWIAAQALVLRGVTIDTNAVVGARAIVTSDVAAGDLVAAGSRC